MALAAQSALARVFTKLDGVALGAALAAVSGSALFLLTLLLALDGSRDMVGYLALLGQYFPGYRVSPAGSLVGLAYGAAAGFGVGWLFAVVRNAALALYLTLAYGRAEKRFLERLFDYL